MSKEWLASLSISKEEFSTLILFFNIKIKTHVSKKVNVKELFNGGKKALIYRYYKAIQKG